jgi:hypothetical protein
LRKRKIEDGKNKKDKSIRSFMRKKQKGSHIIKVKPRRRVAQFVTVVILMAAGVAAFLGVLAVDYNSRMMGWDNARTELAFAATTNRLDFTVMGREYEMDTGVLTQVRRVCVSVENGVEAIKPAPARLLDMLFAALEKNGDLKFRP